MLSRYLTASTRVWLRSFSLSPRSLSVPEMKEKPSGASLHVSHNPTPAADDGKTIGRNLEDIGSFYKSLDYKAIASKYRDRAVDQLLRGYSDLLYIKKAPLPAVGLASVAAVPILLPMFLSGMSTGPIQTAYVSWLLTLAGGTAMGSALQGHPLVTNRNPLVQSAVPPALGLACLMALPTPLGLMTLIGGLGWVAGLDTVYDQNIPWLRALKLAFCLTTAVCLFFSLIHALYLRLAGPPSSGVPPEDHIPLSS